MLLKKFGRNEIVDKTVDYIQVFAIHFFIFLEFSVQIQHFFYTGYNMRIYIYRTAKVPRVRTDSSV